MPDRYPTLLEFWDRLAARRVEPDLVADLESRARETTGVVGRVGREPAVVAFVECILPDSAIPASVLAQFLDQNFDRQLGRGDERVGLLPRAQLIPAGFAALDAAAGGAFEALDREAQDALLTRAEAGELPHEAPGFDSSLWLRRTRDIVLLGYGSDPRGMVQMGFPGPSYMPGYLWLGWGSAAARAARKPGHQRF